LTKAYIYYEITNLLEQAEKSAGDNQDDPRFSILRYGFVLDYMDKFLYCSSLNPDDKRNLTLDALTSFFTYCDDKELAVRFIDHGWRTLFNKDFSTDDAVRLSILSSDPLWVVKQILESELNYETTIEVAMVFGRCDKDELANDLLFQLRLDHDDPVLDDNLRRRLMEEGWPTNTVFGEIRDISEYDETS